MINLGLKSLEKLLNRRFQWYNRVNKNPNGTEHTLGFGNQLTGVDYK